MKLGLNKLFKSLSSGKGQNDIDKQVIKATYSDDTKEPKEKYVLNILNMMHGSMEGVDYKTITLKLANR